MPAWALPGFGPSQTWNGGSGDWNTAAGWDGGTAPTSAANPEIATGTVTVSTSGAVGSEVYVHGGGSLVVGPGGSLQASGLLIAYGGGTIMIGGSVTTGTYYNQDAGTTTVIAAGGALNVTNIFYQYSGSTLVLGNGVVFSPAQFQLNTVVTSSTTITVNGGDTATITTGITDATASTTPVVKRGTGTLILDGASTYGGGTSVLGGTLQVDGSITSNSFVGSGAILRGSGTVADVTVSNGGIVSAGSASAVGTLTVGNLTLNSGSLTALRANGPSSSDQIHVTGNLSLDGTLSITPGADLLNGTTVTLLRADGALGGTYASVVNALGNALTFTTTTVAGTGGTVSVTATQGSFMPFAVGGNGLAVARNLDKVVGDPRAAALLGALNTLPGTSLPAAFTQISPVQQATVAPTTLTVSRAALNTLTSRMSDIRAGSTGLSLSQINLLDQDLPAAYLIAGTDMVEGVKVMTPTPKNKWGFFAATTGNFGDIDGETTQSSFHGAGFTTGADYRIDRSFAVGFAGGYDYSKTDFDHAGSNSTANTVRFGPYATWHNQTGDWADGMVGGAYHWYDARREGFGGTATGSTTGAEFDSSLKYGHDFKPGKNKEWTLTPTFDLDYMRLGIDAYAESGSLAPLSIQDQTTDSFRSNLGGIAAYTFKCRGMDWTPYVSAGWAHEFLDATQTVSARFASGAGDVFSATGDNLGHDSATFGAGLRTTLTETISASLSYSGEANGTYQDHSFDASVRVAF